MPKISCLFRPDGLKVEFRQSMAAQSNKKGRGDGERWLLGMKEGSTL